MLDTNICIYVVKTYPPGLREKFNALVEQLCISPVTLGELHYGAEQSPRRVQNLTAIQHFVARLESCRSLTKRLRTMDSHRSKIYD